MGWGRGGLPSSGDRAVQGGGEARLCVAEKGQKMPGDGGKMW